MLRLRRKYVLYLSGLLLAVFLFFYALINYSISPQKHQVSTREQLVIDIKCTNIYSTCIELGLEVYRIEAEGTGKWLT